MKFGSDSVSREAFGDAIFPLGLRKTFNSVGNITNASPQSGCGNPPPKCFLSGLHAGNYDITHVFVDNFTKMLSEVSEPQIAEFLAWLNDFSERENIQFTLSLSMDPAVTGSEITKYMI